MNPHAKLAQLYLAIPTFTCKPGCSDCCGPVPLAPAEWQKISMAPRKPSAGCLECTYQTADHSCSIYGDRPFLCRLFGATTDAKLRCPHGCGPDKPLNAKQAAILTAKYMKLMPTTGLFALTSDLPRP